MYRKLVLFTALGVSFLSVISNTAFAFDKSHAQWSSVLKKYRVNDGRVHYRLLKEALHSKTESDFPAYLNELAGVKAAEYSAWTENEKIAFLINAYNALTVQLVVENYPVKSIKKIGGLFSSPWKKEFFSLLDGKIKSLDAIEHEYLRKHFNVPLIHAAINCASFSCPKLSGDAFIAANLTVQLENIFREFLNDPLRNRYEPKEGKLYLSEIFKWFGEDFKKVYGNYLKAIEKFGPDAAREALKSGAKVEWIDYDWSLNDADGGGK